MIFKIGFLFLILFLLLFDRNCEEIEGLLYFSKETSEIFKHENHNVNEDTVKSVDILPDVNQELSPEEIAKQIFDEI